MKAKLKVSSNLIIEVEEDKETDLFRGLAKAQEVFAHEACGKCKHNAVKFVVRTVEGDDYFELYCTNINCRAKLPFGQSKENKGGLYPKRKFDSLSPSEKEQRANEKEYAEKHYGYLENGGWYKYVAPKTP